MAGEQRRARLRALLTRIKLRGIDPQEIEPAFVHESAVSENAAERSNERLEFLGDALLGAIVARWLYAEFPAASEGELTLRKAALVSDEANGRTAARLAFDGLMIYGGGLAKAPEARRRSSLGDAFEALVATLYEVAGSEATSAFVVREHIEPNLALGLPWSDPKTVLQEWSQKHYATTPVYRDRAEGPAHDRTFVAHVIVDREVLAEGTGPTKKIAQRAAAALALERLRSSYDDVPDAAPVQAAPAAVKEKPPLKARAAARPRRAPSSGPAGERKKRPRSRKSTPSASGDAPFVSGEAQ
jgi:ribonuclease-3